MAKPPADAELLCEVCGDAEFEDTCEDCGAQVCLECGWACPDCEVFRCQSCHGTVGICSKCVAEEIPGPPIVAGPLARRKVRIRLSDKEG